MSPVALHRAIGVGHWWLVAAVVVAGVGALPVWAQTPPDHAAHAVHSQATATPSDPQLAEQIGQLRAKVAQLEAAMQAREPATPPASRMATGDGTASGMGSMGAATTGAAMGGGGTGMKQEMGMMRGMQKGGGGMSGMGGDKGMMDGMMDMGGGGSAGMSGGGSAMQAMGAGGQMGGMMGGEMGGNMMGMMGMPPGGGMGGMAMPTALPGFPGASHLYHVGASGFFLDHSEHITLNPQQQTTLNQMKEKALLERASTQRNMDEAEQELWSLTGSDQPDTAKIEAKIAELEKLRGQQRMSFIRAVGEAAKVLTDEQRSALMGQSAPQPAPANAPGGGMGGM